MPRNNPSWRDDDDEPEYIDLYDALERIELREALEDEFFYNPEEDNDEAN